MPPPEDFLLLPQQYKGRDCFRVCWGRFPNRSTALAARQQLPQSLSGLSGDPFPLAFSSVTAAGINLNYKLIDKKGSPIPVLFIGLEGEFKAGSADTPQSFHGLAVIQGRF